MKPATVRLVRRGALAIWMAAVAACSGSNDPVAEYPPASSDPDALPGDGGTAGGDATKDAGRDAPEPVAGKKLLSTPVFLEASTTDGHLVFMNGADLSVWPEGAAAPITLQKDFDAGIDSMVVRGRFVAMWLGDSVLPGPMTYWTKASGLQTIDADVYREGLFPRSASTEFAYLVKGSTSLRRTLRVTSAGAGAGTALVFDLDMGYPNEACASTMAFAGTDLVVAGCPNGGTTPEVRAYPLDGDASRAILDDSAPGLWTNHQKTHAVVQTTNASSIRPLSGAGPAVPLDGRIRQAAFSADDTKIVYRDAVGALKRASTSAPASPALLAPSALSILAVSPDARFVVFASSGDVGNRETDLKVVDANAPGTARTIAADEATSFGLSSDGTKLVYIAPRGLALEGPLYVVTLPNGTPQKISDAAERVVFDGDVVYFQEHVKASKTNVLAAARVSSPTTRITIDQALDPLTAQAMVAGGRLFVGSKLGLWEYPALSP